VIPNDVLALWQGNGGKSSQEAAAPGQPTPTGPQKTQESFWWYVMLFVLATVIAESVLASGYLGTQREQE